MANGDASRHQGEARGEDAAGNLPALLPPTLPVKRVSFDGKKLQLIKDTIAKECDDNELSPSPSPGVP